MHTIQQSAAYTVNVKVTKLSVQNKMLIISETGNRTEYKSIVDSITAWHNGMMEAAHHNLKLFTKNHICTSHWGKQRLS